MKLMQFKYFDEIRLGMKTEAGVVDVKAASEALDLSVPFTMESAIAGGDSAREQLETLCAAALTQNSPSYVLNEAILAFAPVVSRPQKIICVGLNYRKHAEETKAEIPTSPILFNKFANALSAHGDHIELPLTSDEVDYEAELAIIIGKTAKNVEETDALNYVYGYSCANDLSARNLQRRTSQWMLGKSCDGFAPIGPYIVTADEVDNPDNLAISCSVNGIQKQNSNTSDMIFSCSAIISYVSKHMTLVPGDIILTGTPEGVVLGYPRDQRVYLQTGDLVEVAIEQLGKLTVQMT
ncbi:2-keto-4-pentenoate hydratase/2-oxohepta-3-ene-1,7-dioic acid hydratase in catechol pathway [Paenibacillus endophyticus]|uniref:2-keto-4-pentenoate hydratase/2-oxohepta-3-ene-1,7-dioic acid hydratase in catechol pathway n=1 Tax=Paenibacillus endophyticus TaxID=1294268 RepID=A0A7W5C4X0_9BACL|nr:fumarylacetoacetate hydrolase family protein [Paenibacillus endophyticus]MBB3150764.1 2-keto-4-pentenoate hydratase/2-oxohepta-3-ene-1,7-dioic acid hydratase in catechol pathway [Paenibacillus endophyticus]